MSSPRLPRGLIHVADDIPGITRKRRGQKFAYYLPDGTKLGDALEIERINALAIPPAYQRVWISPLSNSHLQATGRDARSRKQYRYHAAWKKVRAREKFHQMEEFGEALPTIRAAVTTALRRRELDRDRVIATLVRMLDLTACRIGNLNYRDENGTYGLSTLESEHVEIHGATVDLAYRGKSGSDVRTSLQSNVVAKIVRRLQELPGQHLFKFQDGAGAWHPVESHDVNEWLQSKTGAAFTAKNFRTWHASRLALEVFSETETSRLHHGTRQSTQRRDPRGREKTPPSPGDLPQLLHSSPSHKSIRGGGPAAESNWRFDANPRAHAFRERATEAFGKKFQKRLIRRAPASRTTAQRAELCSSRLTPEL